jgi:hypothetical protein
LPTLLAGLQMPALIIHGQLNMRVTKVAMSQPARVGKMILKRFKDLSRQQ